MLRMGIGEFAQASGLTQKALRLYDDLGLLAPAAVDPHSGYRSYDPAQLGPARLIAALRGVGMPLARIRVVTGLPARAAAVEVRSWWRQVEADTQARTEQVHLLIDGLVTEEEPMTTESTLHLDHGARTDRGLVRESNEDATFAGTRLFAVADGFGAQGTGRTAAQVALDALSALDTSGDDLAGATARARDALAADPRWTGTGTTLTAVLWSGTGYTVAHVGDSRLYLLRGGELGLVTHDHTYVRSLVEDGQLTPEEAAVHPERATLLRALTPESGEPDLHLRDALPGDRHLLCTDGRHAVVGDEGIRDVLPGPDTASGAADRLVAAVHDAGAPDNVACVVIDVVSAP